jgi:hypothetical protein
VQAIKQPPRFGIAIVRGQRVQKLGDRVRRNVDQPEQLLRLVAVGEAEPSRRGAELGQRVQRSDRVRRPVQPPADTSDDIVVVGSGAQRNRVR